MKCLCIVIYYTVITGIITQWPKVNHVKKSAYFPSLEVKIHPPDIYQPQIQMLIQSLENKRELKEKQLLKQIESAYNNELLSASNTITNIITNALSIFDNNNLFHKSISYAITPPLVVLTKSQRVNNNNNDNTRYQSKFKQQNGPITFIETASTTTTAASAQYTKPISVRMKIPKEPDISIKHEIERMERKRDELEEQLCKQALIELKLITKITIKELQLNLKHELLPFYSISSNNNITNNIKSVINSNIKDIESRFIQIYNTNNNAIDVVKRTKCIEMKIKYPYININCTDITNHPGNSSSSSFIEKDSNDFINVKFTSNGNNIDSYPTIEKMISQMMTRRDLSEKYIRLKILETESRLQKALSEFIEDTLHDNIYRIISKYAPAIEGLKEHIK